METGINFAIKTGMELLSFETAKRLKDAGFPQNYPSFGQMWYAESGDLFLIDRFYTHRLAEYFFLVSFDGKTKQQEGAVFRNMVFAPTAAEILQKLPVDFTLQCANKMFFLSLYAKGKEIIQHKSASLSEVAAHAWLMFNEK